ncbi:MASE1 domain-containing protein [Luteibacter sahnii]|uniref:MASE1 domain-containing protein n=1 Tax=Luteibacter sahnii TaxID=3021977 RepID=UPI002A69D5A5|nr:MASE1 domain-containing protein [Luteibacter sp. PPL193]MDY1547070.1 MASE1 domain-containing protein [Luteibacter sp. PPL193]
MSAGAEHWRSWGQHVAVAAAYAAFYRIAYQLSMAHWELTVGFRLCCLLLVPTRFWPALAFGEFLPVLENALACKDDFGSTWAMVASLPQIVLCMAVMKPLRRWGALRDADGGIHMGYVIAATLACALMSTLRDTVSLAVALAGLSREGVDVHTLYVGFSAYLLGGYLGGLTLVPTLLALEDRFRAGPSWATFWRSALTRDMCVGVVPALILLTWLANTADGQAAQQAARLAMLVTAVAMAWRHGWQGMAVAGTGASVALALTSHVVRDPAVIYGQVALALVISAGLLMGGKRQPAAHPLLRNG